MRVAVIGGGPSGTFFTLRFLEDLKKQGKSAEISIIERKLFPKRGPSGCNLCAGLISSSMIRNLGKLGIQIPEGIIQSSIDSYVYHAESGSREFSQFRNEQVFTVYRGGGPLHSQSNQCKSFDQALLEKTVEKGSVHIHGNVTDVKMPVKKGEPYLIHYNNAETLEADFLVGAFGLNTNLTDRFQLMNFGYIPPEALTVAQTEMYFPEGIPERFRKKVHVFNIRFRKHIRFVAMTPKRNYITLTMVGNNPGIDDINDFLFMPRIRELIDSGWDRTGQQCACFPKIPLKPAGRPFADRLVIIGDAHVSRYYKNGIGSAFYTASVAAESIMKYGAAKRGFRSYYIPKCRRRYYHDNIYGRILFMLNDAVAQNSLFSKVPLRVAELYGTRIRKEENILHFILWALFTGEETYKKILLSILNPRLLFDMSVQFVKLLYGRITGK